MGRVKEWWWRYRATGGTFAKRGFFFDHDGDNPYFSITLRWVTLIFWFRDVRWTTFNREKSWGGTYYWRAGPVHFERTERPQDIWGGLLTGEMLEP